MTIQQIIAILLTLTAICSYINYRYLKLTSSIGITLIALIFSSTMMLLTKMGIVQFSVFHTIAYSTDFNTTLMGGLISFLLFAGALHVNTLELAKEKNMVFMLATLGVIISTFLVGSLTWLSTHLLGIPFSFLSCLIFGALIAPTDPIAVMGVLKKISTPKSLEMKIAGESLFNDGTGIVLFVVLLALMNGEQKPEGFSIALLFAQQLFGGIGYGVVLGFVSSYFIRRVNDFHVSALITLATVLAGYLLAIELGVSGPIAIVVTGLIVGAKLRSGLMSEGAIRQLDGFWALVDETLNAMLFVLIGLEFIKLPVTLDAFISALAAIPIVLFSRFISVAAPIALFRPFRRFAPGTISILTWGGLRGGVSIALALSLQQSAVRDEIITITYVVVVFSLLVQGLTIGPFIKNRLQKYSKNQ